MTTSGFKTPNRLLILCLSAWTSLNAVGKESGSMTFLENDQIRIMLPTGESSATIYSVELDRTELK